MDSIATLIIKDSKDGTQHGLLSVKSEQKDYLEVIQFILSFYTKEGVEFDIVASFSETSENLKP